jgi:hypothetical protein
LILNGATETNDEPLAVRGSSKPIADLHVLNELRRAVCHTDACTLAVASSRRRHDRFTVAPAHDRLLMLVEPDHYASPSVE